MDESLWWIIDIIAPAILLIVLIWLVVRNRKARTPEGDARAERATHDLYEAEEQRRREGTDDL